MNCLLSFINFFIQANYDTCSLDYYINSLINKTKYIGLTTPHKPTCPLQFFVCWGEGGESGSINSSSFSELMKLFGLHPYKPTPTYIFWRVANKSLLQPKQHLSHFYIIFYGIFRVGGRWGWVGMRDELIKLEKILYSPYLHTCPQPSSTFLLKVGGFNLKCRLTDHIPTPTLRNSPPPPPPLQFHGRWDFSVLLHSPYLGPLASFSAFYLYTVLTRPSHRRSRPNKVQCVKHAAPCHSSGDQLMI